MKNVAILFLALMMGSIATASAGVRTWTGRSGTHHIEAEFVNVENGKVQLLTFFWLLNRHISDHVYKVWKTGGNGFWGGKAWFNSQAKVNKTS